MEVRQTPDSDLGVFAVKSFQAGDVVFSESPVFVRSPVAQAPPKKIREDVGDILSIARIIVLNLSGVATYW